MRKTRVVIIGSGPAGLSAALYTARAQLNPIVITGPLLGGQVSQTYEIENYPGFPDVLSGAELVDHFKNQAERFGAEVVYDSVTEIDFTQGSPFTVKTYGETYLADTVIVTIGADPRKLKVKGESEYLGHGVSYCATCDGFFFREKEVVVVGGGDSALEEALFLTRFASKVSIIHRRDELRAGIRLQERAKSNPKINFIWNSVVEEINSDELGKVQSVRLKNTLTNEETIFPTQGVFIFIGHIPNSAVFGDQIAVNERGYIITDERYRTNIDGVFAGGEIQDEIWRQVATSVGQGVAAGMSAIHWIEDHEDTLQSLDTVEDIPQSAD